MRTNSSRFLNHILLVVGVFLAPYSVDAATHYVRSGMSGTGVTWNNAFGDLQDALDIATSGDEIWISAGTYTPSQDFVAPNENTGGPGQNATYLIGSGLNIRGGYSATGLPTREDRDIEGNPTILDGNDTSLHVVVMNSVSGSTILDGLVIRGGNGEFSDSPQQNYDGAGILIYNNAAPIIRNCTIMDCRQGSNGSGIFVKPDSTASINNCDFINNNGEGGVGGGLFGENLIVEDCFFFDNRADFGGGGAFGSDCEFNRCDFRGNISSGLGGGVAGSRLIIYNSVFTGNRASTGNDSPAGGGVSLVESGPSWVINCTFVSQTVQSSGDTLTAPGADIRGDGNTVVSNCIFWDPSNQGSPPQNEIHVALVAELRYCHIQNGWTGTGSNNSTDDPLFVDIDGADNQAGGAGSLDNDLRLTESSTCVDTGNNSDALPGTIGSTDVAGLNRINGTTIDRGAYEFLPPEDCNGNMIPDVNDILADPSLDCNGNLRIDSCEIADNPDLDLCGAPGVLDSCEIDDNPTIDCNMDGLIDLCQINSASDCDGNGTLDDCEIALNDCNGNGIHDCVDIRNDPDLDLDMDGIIDICNFMIGGEIEPPEGVDLPGGGAEIGGWVIAPVITPASSAFIHPFDGRVIANDIGAVTIEWASDTGGSTFSMLYGVGTLSSVCMFRTDNDPSFGGGPVVDLSPVVDGDGGGPLTDVIIHYNSVIQSVTNHNPPIASHDAYVETVGPESQTVLQAKKEGFFVLEYRIQGSEEPLAFEGVRVSNNVPSNQQAIVGDRFLPTDPANVDNGCPPVVVRGLGGVGDPLVYQQTAEGPTKGQVFCIKPTLNSSDIQIYWTRPGLGVTGQGNIAEVCWPCELDWYTASWPNVPQLNVRGDGAPGVDLSSHSEAQILYQDPAHANISAERFTTTAPGMATVLYTDNETKGVGERTNFQVVGTEDHLNHIVNVPWRVGEHITDAMHDAFCNDGYLFDGQAANYDPEGLIYDATGTMRGRVFPINEGPVEMWWYEKGTTRQGAPSDVCWPVRPVVYDSTWPTVTDGCVIISNERGFGPLLPEKYRNYTIYEQENLALPGYNPNDEHAVLFPDPQGDDVLLAARDDIDTSSPFVLIQYQDQDQGGEWEFDVISVVRHVPSGVQVPNCPCVEATNGPCTFTRGRKVGTIVTPPIPLGPPFALSTCPENTVVNTPTNEFVWNDRRGNLWFSRGGSGMTGTLDVLTEFYENWRGEGCMPWLDDGTGDPIDVTYVVSWPTIPSDPNFNPPLSSLDVYTTLDIGQTRDRSDFRTTEILFNEAGAVVIFPWKPSAVDLLEVPDDFLSVFALLAPHIQARLSYDDVTQQLQFTGVEEDGLLGIMSMADRDTIKDTFNKGPHAEFRTAIDALYVETQQEGMSTVGVIIAPDSSDWGLAIASGPSMSEGWIVIGYNGRSDIVDPAVLEVFRVGCPPFVGSVQAIAPDCPFDEQITLRWTGDCGGDCADLEFFWQVAAGERPQEYDDISTATGEGGTGPNDPWVDYIDPTRAGTSGWTQGQNEIVVKGTNVRTLTDNWFRVKTRGYSVACGMVTESDYTDAQLAEGWIKRVKRGITPFDQRIKDFTDARVATYVSMLEQLGEPFSDAVAFTCNPERLNALGLIELYQAVLFRGKSITIDSGDEFFPYAPADQALILMAGNLADFYMLLGNEAFQDAADPTVAIDVGTNENASAIFAFQDQLPTNENSLLFEELALMRGRDNRDTPVDAAPVYNRLFWNFTLGDGAVAYQTNYNISDKNEDGFIDAADAQISFPQAHGDAWGHYLTAIKFYYDLLRNEKFNWPIRPEAVLVNQTPVTVSFAHERKFARAAVARANTGVEVMDLTYRERYVENPEVQWLGYEDPVEGRDWGVTDWARRSHMGAQFDWLVANSRLPAPTDEPAFQGTLRQVDRSTVAELRELPDLAQEIQNRLDQADAGLNPLGLAKNVVPFDISPSEIAAGKSHFEQVFERAVQMLNNAIVVFNHASLLSNNLRQNQDEATQFANNVTDRESDFANRLIEIFGYPFPEDKNPVSGDVYGTGFNGPDLYHYSYIDIEDVLGIRIPNGERLMVQFDIPVIAPDDGALTVMTGRTVEFNRVPGFGLVKPREFTQPRKAPGEIQLARSDLLQANLRLDRALIDYDNLMAQIESKVSLLQSFYDISSEEISLQQTALGGQESLNNSIRSSRQRQLDFQLGARAAVAIANAIAEALPQNFVAGLAAGGDFTSIARSAIRLGGTAISEGLGRVADDESIDELQHQQDKEILSNQLQIDLALLQNELQAENQIAELEALIRELSGVENEIFDRQEVVRQSSGRYLAAIARGLRLLEERTVFRQRTAAAISDHRYKDMAFRIFRNDALQKYRAQFDLAVKYIYLTAKAYDFETNLLGADTQSGEAFFTSIVRERTIGQIQSGLPVIGRGLADILARMSQNFTNLEGQLRFNNPQTETNRFSLRRELFRTNNTGLESNANWQEVLERHRVEDLRANGDFRNLCDPLRTIVNSPNPQPGIIIPFETTIQNGLNFFGWPLSGGDSNYSTSNFVTKVRSVGVWFSNYNNTASQNGLTQTPRIFLVPAGADVLRVPTVNIGQPREWFLTDQVIPVPFPLNSLDLMGDREWLPSLDNFGGASDFGRPRRFGDFRAFHDGGSFDVAEVISDSRLIGRSVWNTRWLLIIPGSNLLADPELGIDRLIYGGGSPGDGVTDILLFFQTYAHTSGKSDE